MAPESTVGCGDEQEGICQRATDGMRRAEDTIPHRPGGEGWPPSYPVADPSSSLTQGSQTVSVWYPGERTGKARRFVGTGFPGGCTGVTRPRRSGYLGRARLLDGNLLAAGATASTQLPEDPEQGCSGYERGHLHGEGGLGSGLPDGSAWR